jgi:putative MATE family efflux protein
VARIASAYFQVTMGTVVVVVALIIGGGVLRGAGDSKTPMMVTAVANVVNVILAYGLIYGHWGLPAMGPVGSAWATFLARGLALVLLLRVLWVGRNGVGISGREGWRPDFSVARRVLGLGAPAALEQILITSAFLALTVLVGHLGTATLAAQRISMSALSLSFMPGFGFSIAATTLVGQSIGARRPWDAEGIARFAATWAAIWMSAIGAIFFFFAEPIMHRFTADMEVVRIGAAGLRVVALTQPAWAIGMVHAGSLRGTSDTRFPLLVSTLGVWTAVLLAWGLLSWVGGGLTAVWTAFLITSPITATASVLRFRYRLRTLTEEAQKAGVDTSPVGGHAG